MEPIAFVRRTALGLLGTALGAALLTVAAHGSEAPASGSSLGLTIHGPDETLRDFCAWQEGRLWLTIPGSVRCELVTATTDPAIANPGDGHFHPFAEAEVRAALGALDYSLADLNAEVFLLPYPRRAGLESAAGPGIIFLAPGVWPLTPEHQHAEFVHELGHVVQYARMPDADAAGWARYRDLRGIADVSTYNASAPHANRPHEIFAEDFRALFGGSLARYSGSIENPTLAPPTSVAGLADFMVDLAAANRAWAGAALACFPNPSNRSVSFSRPNGVAVPLDVFDLTGRRIVTLAPSTNAGATAWRWDGTDLGGTTVGPGVFFARPRDGGPALRVTRAR